MFLLSFTVQRCREVDNHESLLLFLLIGWNNSMFILIKKMFL